MNKPFWLEHHATMEKRGGGGHDTHSSSLESLMAPSKNKDKSDAQSENAKIADALCDPVLAALRQSMRNEHLVYEKRPAFVGAGALNRVFSLTVKDGRDGSDHQSLPLVCRLPRSSVHLDETREAAIHEALIETGVSAPDVMATGHLDNTPFLVMRRLRGLDGMKILGIIIMFGLIIALIKTYLWQFDFPAFLLLLSGFFCFWLIQIGRFHRIPVERFERGLELHNEPPEALRPHKTLDELDQQATSEAARCGIQWLREHPVSGVEAVVHGDLHPGNFMVHWYDGVSFLDLSRVCIAHPEYDYAWFGIIKHLMKPPSLIRNPGEAIGLTLIRILLIPLFLPVYLLARPFLSGKRLRFYRVYHAVYVLVLIDNMPDSRRLTDRGIDISLARVVEKNIR